MYQSIISQTCEYQGFIFKNVRVDPAAVLQTKCQKMSGLSIDRSIYTLRREGLYMLPGRPRVYLRK